MSVSQADVVGLYLAYFGRPPDPGGVAFYVNDPGFDIWGVAAAFSASPESQALYGTFGYAQINAIYQNLFNRDAEPDGLAYWYGEVQAGRLTPGGIAFAIYLGAQNADKVAVQNKLTVANAFLAALDTTAEISGYAGDTAAARARAFIHTVDSTGGSVALAEAFLATQVAFATGLVTLTFSATKNASNVVTFSNAGSGLSVTESGGTLTFTSFAGNTGSASVAAPIAGIEVPTGTTLTISSAIASSKAFTGDGTALVVADAAGEDLSTTLTATGVDSIQLTTGKDYTLTTAQLEVARIGAFGTIGVVTDTGRMTVIGALDNVSGANATALRAKGADVVAGLVATGGDITTKSITGVDRIDLASGQNYIVTEAQAALIGRAPGAQTVTIANAAAAGITLAAEVETFQLSNFPSNNVKMGAAAQIVLGGSGADTLTPIDGVTSTSDLKAGANVITVAAGTNISKGTFNATGGTVEFNLDDATTATLSVAQVALVSSAEGTQNITLGTVATGLTLDSRVETFTLGDFVNSVTMSDVEQIVIGGSKADTVTVIDGVTSTSDLMAGANIVVVGDGYDISEGVFNATGGTVQYSLNGVSTATLSGAQATKIGTATGTQTITVATLANGTLGAAAENFVLGNFANNVTLGAAAQNVTGGTGADTVTTGGVAASGTMNGGGGASDKLIVDADLGAATVTAFELLHVADDSDVSLVNGGAALGTATLTMIASVDLKMTVAQNEAMKASASVTGTSQSITLADAGTTTAIAGIETYNFAAGSSTIATGGVGQTFNANALADGEVLTLTGTHAASITLVAGDLDASAATGALTVTATTGTNVIATGSGNDTVTGGAGLDTIDLGTGNDVVVLNSLSGTDSITGFGAGDKVQFSKATFTGLGTTGALAGTAFESSAGLTSAATAAGRVIYDTSTGDLYYDADGAGGTGAVLVATLTGLPALAAVNFVIIS
jgi:hypothetical protein